MPGRIAAKKEDQVARMPRTELIQRLTFEGKEIILVGTAHISSESARLTETIIQDEKPETVCVELCRSRYRSMTEEMPPQNLDFREVTRVAMEREPAPLLLNMLFSHFQDKLGHKLGIKPGEDIKSAIRSAESVGARIHLIDRDARITFLRVWRTMRAMSKVRFIGQLLASLSDTGKIGRDDIEKLKDQDALDKLMAELGDSLPELRQVVIDERDRFMAHMIRHAPGRKIVAIVGAGHVAGIKRNWFRPVDLAELNQIPPGHALPSFIKWYLPAFVVMLIIFRLFADKVL
jgi:pheromone shutdown-related protein TraB